MTTKTMTAAHADLLARLENNDDDAIDQYAYVSMLGHDILMAAANGEIDLNDLARFYMSGSGYDRQGKWVGFNASKETWARQEAA